jgi:RNA polymerase sigma factor (sigma-70 family)
MRSIAQDTFQAVFLVLARKARSIRDPDLLGNWLYGVALRTARCAKHQTARRRKREEGDAMGGSGSASYAPPADRPALDREEAEAIHGAIARLPGAFRLPVVLCYFEGLTLDEAARRLRCPAGTVRSRLARARDKLRRSLVRRGVAVPAAALGAVLAPRSVSASVSPLLCETTTRAATTFAVATRHAAAGASAAVLAREVLRTMVLQKLKVSALAVLLLATAATGAGVLTHALAMKEETMKDPAPQVASAEPSAGVRMTVAGRVLDPDGKPVQGAVIDLVTRPRVPWVGASEGIDRFTLLGQGQSRADGWYRVDAPRTASTRVFEVYALAAAPGYGLGWAELNPDAEQPAAEIKLAPEQPVRVRLVDVTGAPARGVQVRVLSVGRATDKGTYQGVGLWVSPPGGIRSWPRPVATDEQGRLTVPGIGRGEGLVLGVRDLRYAQQDLHIKPGGDGDSKETILALEPARIIEGRALAADTERPIPHAIVSATAYVKSQYANGFFTAKFRADAEGRFTMNPQASDSYTLGAFPTGGEPYLIQQDELKWTKGTARATHDIKLRRGVLINGEVTVAGSDRPLPASSIQFIPVRGSDKVLSGWQAIVASGDDGSFQIAVPLGKGHLLVFGPTGDYVLDEIGANQLYNDRPGGYRYYAHAIIPYEVKAGDPTHQVAAALRPGVTIKGRVLGPEGQTVEDAFVLTTLRIEAFNPHWRGDFHVPIRDGRFELNGLGPEASTRIHLLAPENEWGASVDISGAQAGADLTIRLQPCGCATARFVGPDGRPIARHQPHLEFVITPGPNRLSRSKHDQAELASNAEIVVNIDRKHYWNGFRTDAEGRITMPSLIPGARYQIVDFSTINDRDTGAQLRKEFTVQPGETLDLGDIRIDKPEAR